jgi:hypothetical protein
VAIRVDESDTPVGRPICKPDHVARRASRARSGRLTTPTA